MRSITLFMPGLFGPDMPIHPDDLPDLPALNWMLTRGEIKQISILSPSYALCRLFGLSVNENNDFPIAPISRLNDDDQYSEGRWIRADPVHVSVDCESLILMDQHRFKLSQHDAIALATDINQVLESHGLMLEVPVAYRWYVRVIKPQLIQTTPLDLVVGKNILPFMPKGNSHINWIQLLNEIQMILHASDVNRMREQEKKLPINSVWFWGYGALPKCLDRRWSYVVSDDVLGKGLSMITATPFSETPENFEMLRRNEDSFNMLVTINVFQNFINYHDPEGWLDTLLYYEQNWFASALRGLKNKEYDQLHIRTTAHMITLDSVACFKFWRKQKNILAFKK